MSLKLKLGLLITSLVVLTVALVALFLLRQQQQSLVSEMTKRGLAIAENLAAGARTSLLQNDDLSLNVLVRDAMRDGDVAYVVVADYQGMVRAHSDVSKLGKPVERPAEIASLGPDLLVRSYRSPDLGRIIDFAVPLHFSGVELGALYLGFSDRSIVAALARARNQTVLISVVMVAVAIAGAAGLATVLVRPIFRLVEATRVVAGGNFQVAVPVSSRDEIGVLTDSFNQMTRSLREKEMIKRAFSRYVAREVVEEVLKDPEHTTLRGERREVTVLFCDIRGFTPLSERLTPEQVVTLLNDFYTIAIESVFQRDGTLDKFLGDGVMAIFGAPIYHPDHALRAVQAALALQDAVRTLSDRRVREGKEPFVVGIGLNAGEVVAGTVGTEDRMEYTVVGDSVNIASRLESNAKPGQILISRRTFDMVGDQVDVTPLGALRVKGKGEEIEVFEVAGLKEAVA